MKAISLWQPWASAVARGAKTIETRSWRTNYRGPLAIHAAKRKVICELIHYGSMWGWRGALGLRDTGTIFDIPFGAIIAVCELIDCRPTGTFTVDELDTHRGQGAYVWDERMLGNFEPGRFGWILRGARPFPEPIPYRGRQGFFEIPDDIVTGGERVPTSEA